MSDIEDSHRASKLKNKRFQVDEWSINAVIDGDGPPVLFIHGIGASCRWWQPTLEAMSQDFTVCAIDLPGSGDSSPLASRPNPAAYKTLVMRAIEFMDCGPAIVVGHSLGGFVAVQAAMQQTPGIRGLFLIAPAGFGRVENGYLRHLSIPGVGDLAARSRRVGLEMFLRSLVHDNRQVAFLLSCAVTSQRANKHFLYQLRLGLDRLGRTTDTVLFKNALGLPVPIRLIWGKHDSVFALSTARHAQHELGHPSMTIFEDSGHFPQLEEQGRFNALLRSFAIQV